MRPGPELFRHQAQIVGNAAILVIRHNIMEPPREPHAVSLKVLRLSRPSLSQSVPLPRQSKTSSYIDSDAALDLGPQETDEQFLFSPVLTLPPAFGSAYVGETFSCTLCANNELSADAEHQVTSIRVGAEMQAPSGTIPLEATPSDDEYPNRPVKLGCSIQKIVRFDLREEGNHTLAVNLSYSETTLSKDQSASSGRVRNFRKLYQFVCRPCLNVRTKVSNLPGSGRERFAVEIQLDNMADGTITLKDMSFNPKSAFKSISLNKDMSQSDNQDTNCTIMAPRDIMQIAFLVEQEDGGSSKEVTKDGRTVLGQLGIQWRTAMGDPGFLTTGGLAAKRR